MNNLLETFPERFLAKVRKTDGCWLWIAGCSSNGYGRIAYHHRTNFIYAHRGAWLLFKGEIPDGLLVCHHCDVRNCVNPDHLFLGTNKDNLHDSALKGRMHPGSLHGSSKLTEKDVRSIRTMSGTQRHIADLFGVSQSRISVIRSHQNWKHVT